jgi:hypothetical protein
MDFKGEIIPHKSSLRHLQSNCTTSIDRKRRRLIETCQSANQPTLPTLPLLWLHWFRDVPNNRKHIDMEKYMKIPLYRPVAKSSQQTDNEVLQ